MILSIKSWAVFLGVVAVDTVLLIKLLTTQSSTSLIFAIVAITALLIFSFRLEDIVKAILGKDEQQLELSNLNARLKQAEDNLTEAQSKIEAIELRDFNTKLKKIEDNLTKIQSEIAASGDKIDNLSLLLMGSDIYITLKKIASGHFGEYHKKSNGILDRELRYLRVIGYIEVKDNVIARIPERGKNLSEYVWTTETGRDFVALRDSIEQHRSQGAG